jgi:hypothetical protein
MTTHVNRRSSLALCCAAAIVSGCGGVADVTPGETLDINEEFVFYLHHHGEEYVELPLAEIIKLVGEKSWQVPQGMTLDQPVTNVTSTKVTWKSGNTEYTADGYRLKVSGKLAVSPNAQTGDSQLAVKLPDLVSTAKNKGLTLRQNSSSDLLSSSDSLVIKKITVHSSAAVKALAKYGPPVLITGGIVIGLVILVIIGNRQKPAAGKVTT